MVDVLRDAYRLDEIGSLSALHAADRLTAKAWFGRLEPEGAPSSNVEAQELPFQRWYRFKEAFSPRFVSEAIAALPKRPHVCIDPFGGSGTTALTCQFLGVAPATIEVNPFLADLIEAKLCSYDVTTLIRDYARVVDAARTISVHLTSLSDSAPATFVEPGVNDRWIFDRGIARRLLAYREAIRRLRDRKTKRLFRVLLGSIAVKLSNVVISGKGRRYRSSWELRDLAPKSVEHAFQDAAERAIADISRYGRRAERQYTLLRGDSRRLVEEAPVAEFALFSPPYPNSFDYTDIYNVELWLLGYLSSSKDNRALREATLRSHVQIKRSYDCELPDSRILNRTIKALRREGDRLWDREIPAMVQAYFGDMATVLRGLVSSMSSRADIMMVIGDSRYAGVKVDVAAICAELAPDLGLKVIATRPIRSMRASAQQGGRHDLSETLLHFRKIR